MKKNSGSLFGVLAVLFAVAIATIIVRSDGFVMAQTPPVLPHTFHGEVTVNGTAAVAGLPVQARLDDNVNYAPGNPTTGSGGTYGVDSSFRVCGDTGFPGRQGGINGDTIEFFVLLGANWFQAETLDINGDEIDNVLFDDAAQTRLDLVIDTSSGPAQAPSASSDACTLGDASPTPTSTPVPGPQATSTLIPDDDDGGGRRATSTPTPTFTATNTPTATATEDIGLDNISLEQAVQIVSGLNASDAARRLERTSTGRAAAILDLVPNDHVEDIIEALSFDAVTRILTQMSSGKLRSLNPQVIFEAILQVPARLLLPDDPPTAEPGFDDPVAVQVSDTLVLYQVASTGEFVWVPIVASPAPIDSVLAKFNRVITDVQVEVEDLNDPPAGSPDFGADEIVNSLFRIDIGNAEASDVVVGYATVYLSKSWIAQNDIHPMSVKLNRLDEESNTWVPLPARRSGEDDERVFYTVAVPGFSVFAITGSDQPQTIPFVVDNLSISPAAPAANSDIIISAEVTNTGSVSAIYPADLLIDNVIEDSEYVPVGAGQTETVSFTIRRPEGIYGIRIERIIDQLVVGQPVPTATNTPTSTPVPPTATAVPTDTPVPPTATNTSTNTPVPPTATAVPTDTPVPPTATAVPTDTPVPPTATAVPPTASPTSTPVPEPPTGGGNLALIIGIIIGIIVILAGGIALFAIFRRRAA